MGLSIADLVGGVVSSVPIPGAGAVGNFIAGLDDGKSNLPAEIRPRNPVGRLVQPGPGTSTDPYGGSVLGPAEVLIPDPVERYIGTMPGSPQTNGDCLHVGQIAYPAETVARAKCAKGYVAVTCPDTGAKVCVLKSVARARGLWKPARKPPIKASDWRSLMAAERTAKKIDRVVQAANKVTGKAKYKKSR